MALIHSWATAAPRGQLAFLLCDGCDPQRLFVGPIDRARKAGWTVDESEGAAQFCPWCVDHEHAEGRWVPVSEHPALPNLVIVGAQKSGTTSLHRYLDLHPEISMAAGKELHFFCQDRTVAEIERYATHFDGQAPIRGEASPTYAHHPVVEGVPDRIKRTLDHVRLIYLVRNPVERTVASYVEATSHGWDPLPLAEALSDVEDPRSLHAAQSRFGAQLERYLEVFDRDQILVLDQSELARDRRGTLQRVFEFLEVDPTFWTDEFNRRHNTREEKWMRTPFGKRLRRTRLARWIRGLPARPRNLVFSPIRRLTRTGVERTPQLPDTDRARLRDALASDIELFERLAGFRPGEPPDRGPYHQADDGRGTHAQAPASGRVQ